jgi:hypothetical protein
MDRLEEEVVVVVQMEALQQTDQMDLETLAAMAGREWEVSGEEREEYRRDTMVLQVRLEEGEEEVSTILRTEMVAWVVKTLP